jgi:hypothetical protein
VVKSAGRENRPGMDMNEERGRIEEQARNEEPARNAGRV